MPVFVAAIKSRRGRERHWGQSSRVSTTAYSTTGGELAHSASEACTASDANGSSVSEESWIKRNLKTFYTDFESEKERAILKNSSPPRRRLDSHCSVCSMEEAAAHNPQEDVRMEDERTSPLRTSPTMVPNGVEKSFKSRRSFSKCAKNCWLTCFSEQNSG